MNLNIVWGHFKLNISQQKEDMWKLRTLTLLLFFFNQNDWFFNIRADRGLACGLTTTLRWSIWSLH